MEVNIFTEPTLHGLLFHDVIVHIYVYPVLLGYLEEENSNHCLLVGWSGFIQEMTKKENRVSPLSQVLTVILFIWFLKIVCWRILHLIENEINFPVLLLEFSVYVLGIVFHFPINFLNGCYLNIILSCK